MAIYRGTLGDSALGEVDLGAYESAPSVLAARVTQEAVEVLYVSASIVLMAQEVIELLYASEPVAYITQVAFEILHSKGPSAFVTQDTVEVLGHYNPTIHETQYAVEVLHVQSSTSRITQFAVEVLDVYNPTPRITQDAVEVLYQYIAPTDIHFTQAMVITPTITHSSLLNRTVTSAIHVGQTIGGGSYTLSITSNIFVSQIITATDTAKHLSVTSNITVAPTITFNRDLVFEIISDILVTPTIDHRLDVVNQSITSNISVTPSIRVARMVSLTVTSNINVATIITHASNVVSMSVTSNISLIDTIFFRNTVVRINVMSNLNAASGGTGRSDIVHKAMETDIDVSSIIVARNTNVPSDVLSTLTLTATIFARSTIVHINLISPIFVDPHITVFNPNIIIESDIHTTQTIATRNTINRIAIQSNVLVTPIVRHSPNEQSLQSNIFVDGSTFNTAIKFYISPFKYTFFHQLYVDSIITGGNSNRNISVEDDILVTQDIRNGYIEETVISAITLNDTISGGSSQRSFSLQDNIAILGIISIQRDMIHINIVQPIDVKTQISLRGIPIELEDDIFTYTQVDFSIIRHQTLTQGIELSQTIIAAPDTNRQSVTDNLTLTQVIRSSPNYQTVITPINVSSRIRQLQQTIVSIITVDQQVNLNFSRLIIQHAPITQTLTATRILNRTIRSDIAVSSIIKANHDYVRTIIQPLPVFDTFYPLNLSFTDYPVLIPVAIGTIVSATLMTIRGQHGAILLPPAQLNDSVEGIGKMNVAKSMDGTAFSYVQKVDRQKLTYKWLLPHLKVYELRTFVGNNISDILTMENWKGETWIVRMVSNPFAFSNQGVWEKDKEFAEVEIQFEGKKVGG